MRPSVTRPLSDLEKVWVLEAWLRRFPDGIVPQLNAVKKDLEEIGVPVTPDVTACTWTLIMTARDLETGMRWATKKNEEGMIVRLRNTQTGDIIMGAIFGNHGAANRPITPE